jgi:hypothetical protein
MKGRHSSRMGFVAMELSEMRKDLNYSNKNWNFDCPKVFAHKCMHMYVWALEHAYSGAYQAGQMSLWKICLKFSYKFVRN